MAAMYHLPSSPTIRVLDRFSTLPDEYADDDQLVSFWPLLSAILLRPVSTTKDVVDALEEIAHVLRQSTGPAGDYGTLSKVLNALTFIDVRSLWTRIIGIALRMPDLFPTSSLPVLTPGMTLRLSRSQAACLVAHQFLTSLASPRDRSEYYDFGIWYDSEQPHPRAAEMYITAMCVFFADLPDINILEEYATRDLEMGGGVSYVLASAPARSVGNTPMSPFRVLHNDVHVTGPHSPSSMDPNGALVVAANKVIGFGKSATGEEVTLGTTPEACPAVLVTPVLTGDQVVVITGASPVLRVTGERRNVAWEIPDTRTASADFDAWRMHRAGGPLLLMDALELDEHVSELGQVPDLVPENIEREVHKATTAFMATAATTVYTPLWGCGAFCGDPAVKMCLLWLAASMASVELVLLLDARGQALADELEPFVRRWQEKTAAELRQWLGRVPRTLRGGQVLAYIDT